LSDIAPWDTLSFSAGTSLTVTSRLELITESRKIRALSAKSREIAALDSALDTTLPTMGTISLAEVTPSEETDPDKSITFSAPAMIIVSPEICPDRSLLSDREAEVTLEPTVSADRTLSPAIDMLEETVHSPTAVPETLDTVEIVAVLIALPVAAADTPWTRSVSASAIA